MPRQTFIAFGTVSDFIGAVDRDKPINATSIEDPGRPDRRFGISYVRQYIVLSQVQGSEVVYWRGKVGVFSMVSGEVYPGVSKHEERVLSAYNLTVEYLKSNGLDMIRRAIVDFPSNYKHTDGSISHLSYDKESDRFIPLAKSEDV